MRKLLWALGLPLVMACNLAQPTPPVVVQTVVVQPTAIRATATARPQPTATTPSFNPVSLGWTPEPSYDSYCGAPGCAYSHFQTGELLHVYDDGLVFGWDLAGDYINQGAISGTTAAVFGITTSVFDDISAAVGDPSTFGYMYDGGTYENVVDGWFLNITIDSVGLSAVIGIFKNAYGGDND